MKRLVDLESCYVSKDCQSKRYYVDEIWVADTGQVIFNLEQFGGGDYITEVCTLERLTSDFIKVD